MIKIASKLNKLRLVMLCATALWALSPANAAAQDDLPDNTLPSAEIYADINPEPGTGGEPILFDRPGGDGSGIGGLSPIGDIPLLALTLAAAGYALCGAAANKKRKTLK